MSISLNRVFIVGRLVTNPELRQTPGGQSVCNFSLATNRSYTGKDGIKHEDTEFHNCVSWGKQGEVIAQYMTKGATLLVEGRLETRTWEDKEGKKQYKTEIIVDNFQMGPRSVSNKLAQEESTPDTLILPSDM